MAKIILKFPKASSLPLSWQIICEIIPNPGRIKICTSGFQKIRRDDDK
jgi:hypothetical protein